MTIYLTNGTVLTFKDANCVISLASDSIVHVRMWHKDGTSTQIATFYKDYVMGWHESTVIPSMRTA